MGEGSSCSPNPPTPRGAAVEAVGVEAGVEIEVGVEVEVEVGMTDTSDVMGGSLSVDAAACGGGIPSIDASFNPCVPTSATDTSVATSTVNTSVDMCSDMCGDRFLTGSDECCCDVSG